MTTPYAKVLSVPSTPGIVGNDSKHNKIDLNKGGGPAFRNRKKVPPVHRGGFGQHGQAKYGGSASGTPRAAASNPGKSPTIDGEARGGAMRPEQRVPGHGGAPQHRGGTDMTRQFGMYGKTGVPNDYAHSNPKPGAGNVGGRMAKRITGRFTNKSKGPRAGGLVGKYGSAPVRLDS